MNSETLFLVGFGVLMLVVSVVVWWLERTLHDPLCGADPLSEVDADLTPESVPEMTTDLRHEPFGGRVFEPPRRIPQRSGIFLGPIEQRVLVAIGSRELQHDVKLRAFLELVAARQLDLAIEIPVLFAQRHALKQFAEEHELDWLAYRIEAIEREERARASLATLLPPEDVA